MTHDQPKNETQVDPFASFKIGVVIGAIMTWTFMRIPYWLPLPALALAWIFVLIYIRHLYRRLRSMPAVPYTDSN